MGDVNPFADPNDVNPFADPSVANATRSTGIEEYNPFAQQPGQPAPGGVPPPQQHAAAPQPAAPSYAQQPATIEPTRNDPPPKYPSYSSHSEQENMRKRQEELERKAADLAKREAELKSLQQQVERQNNFPPLPKFCCVQPCFFHDISLDIPIESQKTCRMVFYLWQLYAVTLMYNFICSLALFASGGSSGATTFGVSMLYLFLFLPCSFVLWYRPLYKALKNDSSFNFMLFFFCFFFQIVFGSIYALGIPGFGTCGWINAAKELDDNNTGVAVMMLICGALFTVEVVLAILLLKKVHAFYRLSGASMQKAQGEFARDVMSNKNVQSAAAEAVKTGVQQSANRY